MNSQIPTTIKDQELVAQRRGEIIDVATRLFLDRGFHKTSIRDIARACPFNLASLYMYVTSKEDILFLVAQQLIEEKAKAMAAVEMLDDDPADVIPYRTPILLPDRAELSAAYPVAVSGARRALAGTPRNRYVVAVHGDRCIRKDRAQGHRQRRFRRCRPETGGAQCVVLVSLVVAARARVARFDDSISTHSSTCRARSCCKACSRASRRRSRKANVVGREPAGT